MDRAGVSRHVAMQITGHKTESMYRRYNIVSDDTSATRCGGRRPSSTLYLPRTRSSHLSRSAITLADRPKTTHHELVAFSKASAISEPPVLAPIQFFTRYIDELS